MRTTILIITLITATLFISGTSLAELGKMDKARSAS